MLTKNQTVKIKKEIEKTDEYLPLTFGVLADPSRYRIFKLLVKYQNICVTDVASILEISVPAASQQLRLMEISGLVIKERMGQMICYKLKRENPLVKSFTKIIYSETQRSASNH